MALTLFQKSLLSPQSALPSPTGPNEVHSRCHAHPSYGAGREGEGPGLGTPLGPGMALGHEVGEGKGMSRNLNFRFPEVQ